MKIVKLVPHILDQVGLKVQKYYFRSQMCLHLKNACETNRCLIVHRWSNDGSDRDVSLILCIMLRKIVIRI
jgi:hypothetical protein